jgi:uncharacterized protein (DUF488 family)
MPRTVFTIGHSTRSIPEFVDLLRQSGVDLVVDVRSMPRSRTNPQFNTEALSGTLGDFQIGYRHIAPLGGLRKKQMPQEDSPNGCWRVKSFQRYADYALGREFAAGLSELRALAVERRPAIMCAEAVWWRCHRRIISDYLLAAGDQVFHILAPGKVEEARLNEGARVLSADRIEYPKAQDQ